MVRLLSLRAASASVAIAAIAAVTCAGCGEARPTDPRAADARFDPTERIVRLKVALTELRDDPDASGSSIEVSRAETWVARAEALTRTHTDPELRDLLLETAEGQVTMVRSAIALRKSTRALGGRAPSSKRGPEPARPAPAPETDALPPPAGAPAPPPSSP
jgi:hypothetical protein